MFIELETRLRQSVSNTDKKEITRDEAAWQRGLAVRFSSRRRFELTYLSVVWWCAFTMRCLTLCCLFLLQAQCGPSAAEQIEWAAPVLPVATMDLTPAREAGLVIGPGDFASCEGHAHVDSNGRTVDISVRNLPSLSGASAGFAFRAVARFAETPRQATVNRSWLPSLIREARAHTSSHQHSPTVVSLGNLSESGGEWSAVYHDFPYKLAYVSSVDVELVTPGDEAVYSPVLTALAP